MFILKVYERKEKRTSLMFILKVSERKRKKIFYYEILEVNLVVKKWDPLGPISYKDLD